MKDPNWIQTWRNHRFLGPSKAYNLYFSAGSPVLWYGNKHDENIYCGFPHAFFPWLQADEKGELLSMAWSTRHIASKAAYGLKDVRVCWDSFVTQLQTAIAPLINPLCLTVGRFMTPRLWNQNAIKHSHSVQLELPDTASEIFRKRHSSWGFEKHGVKTKDGRVSRFFFSHWKKPPNVLKAFFKQ